MWNETRYEQFMKDHFAAIYRYCTDRLGDEPSAAIAAQRIALDLYRLETAEA